VKCVKVLFIVTYGKTYHRFPLGHQSEECIMQFENVQLQNVR
jgi:hypothetical protein